LGRIVVKAKLWNFADEIKAREGLIKPEEIRVTEIEALIDTVAPMLSLPGEIVKELGLLPGKPVRVSYADGRVEERGVAYGVKIEIMGREAETYALVEEKGRQVLVSQVVLETLDLIPDPKRGVLKP
jgi:predicted aspartyl protease